LDCRAGLIVFRAFGDEAAKCFKYEHGGHRFQRVSPTEKRGRVHTSTITVVVLPEPMKNEINVNEKDLIWNYSRGSGPGGQNKNKTNTAVQLIHKPTGLMVRADSRSQTSNKELAFTTLQARLFAKAKQESSMCRDLMRKEQVGSGMRGDKIRTVCQIKGVVFDKRTGKKIPLKKYEKGYFDELME